MRWATFLHTLHLSTPISFVHVPHIPGHADVLCGHGTHLQETTIAPKPLRSGDPPKLHRLAAGHMRTMFDRTPVPPSNVRPPSPASIALWLWQWMTSIPTSVFSFTPSIRFFETLVFGYVEKAVFWAAMNPFPVGRTRGQLLTPCHKGRFGYPMWGAH